MKTTAKELRRELEGIQHHSQKISAYLFANGLGMDETGLVRTDNSFNAKSEANLETQIAVESISRFIGELNTSRRPLLTLDCYRYAFGLTDETLKQIGTKHHITAQRVARLSNQILSRLGAHKSRKQHSVLRLPILIDRPDITASVNQLAQALTANRIAGMCFEVAQGLRQELRRLEMRFNDKAPERNCDAL